MVSEAGDCSSSNDSLPCTSGAEAVPPPQSKSPLPSLVDDDDGGLYTWSMCPMGPGRVFSIVFFIVIYSFLFLFFAQHSTLMLIIMTGMIAIWTVFLYTTGIMCILYMIIREYPPPPSNEFEIGDTSFSKLSKRVSLEATLSQANAIKEYKF